MSHRRVTLLLVADEREERISTRPKTRLRTRVVEVDLGC